MKKMNRFVGVALLALVVSFTSNARAEETDAIYVRAKAGPALYSNIDPVTSTFGYGLDIGFRCASGFGVAAMAKRFTINSGRDNSSANVSIRTEVKSFFAGVIPSYSVTKGIATLSFGLGVGVLSMSTQVDTFIVSPPSSSASPDMTRSRFALAPNFEVDIDITSGLFGNIGVQYIASFGESPKPSILTPMAGVGYRF